MRNQTICRRATRLAAAFVLAAASAGAAALFPQPLHIVRTIEDPIAKTTVTVEEFCFAQRIVSIKGNATVIEDFASHELIEIDRTANTFSVTSFEALANARTAGSETATAAPEMRATTARVSKLGHPVDVFESVDEIGGVERRIEVAVDRDVQLTRDALDALAGAAHPQSHGRVHDVILAAAATPRTSIASAGERAESQYALPVEVAVTLTAGGEALTERNLVVSVDRRTIAPEALLIPPGATRVESRLLRFAKEGAALDHPKGR